MAQYTSLERKNNVTFMTHAYRKKLFALFVILFAIVGVVVLYYTFGYRFDIETFTVHKAGALYIETTPRSVAITLGDEPYKDESSLLQRGTLLSGIFPKRYHLAITKEGYHPYEKNVEIVPSQVTRVTNVLLVPTTIATTTYTIPLSADFVLATAQNHIVFYDQKTKAYKRFDTTTSTAPINLFSKITALAKTPIETIARYPQEKNRFIIKTAKGIFTADVEKASLQPIAKVTNIAAWTTSENNLYYITPVAREKNIVVSSVATPPPATFALSVYDLMLAKDIHTYTIQLPSFITSLSFLECTNTLCVLVTPAGSLFTVTLEEPTLIQQIADKAKLARFSPDGSRLLYQDKDGKTFVYLFKDDLVSLNAKKGDALYVRLSDAGHIQDMQWIDNAHILCFYDDKITIAEITSSEPNNQFVIVGAHDHALYDSQYKTLYIQKESRVIAYPLSFE